LYTSLKDGERLLYENSANLLRKFKAIGGKLMVTDQRVIFETDALDLETGLISVTYKKIKKVKSVNTLMVIPNGIELELKSRDKFRFAVWKRKELLELINKKISGKKGRD